MRAAPRSRAGRVTAHMCTRPRALMHDPRPLRSCPADGGSSMQEQDAGAMLLSLGGGRKEDGLNGAAGASSSLGKHPRPNQRRDTQQNPIPVTYGMIQPFPGMMPAGGFLQAAPAPMFFQAPMGRVFAPMGATPMNGMMPNGAFAMNPQRCAALRPPRGHHRDTTPRSRAPCPCGPVTWQLPTSDRSCERAVERGGRRRRCFCRGVRRAGGQEAETRGGRGSLHWQRAVGSPAVSPSARRIHRRAARLAAAGPDHVHDAGDVGSGASQLQWPTAVWAAAAADGAAGDGARARGAAGASRRADGCGAAAAAARRPCDGVRADGRLHVAWGAGAAGCTDADGRRAP